MCLLIIVWDCFRVRKLDASSNTGSNVHPRSTKKSLVMLSKGFTQVKDAVAPVASVGCRHKRHARIWCVTVKAMQM